MQPIKKMSELLTEAPLQTLDGSEGFIALQGGQLRAGPLSLIETLIGSVSGSSGWTPQFQTATDGQRSVLRISDWTGGTGTKPAVGYLSNSGLVSDIAQASNIRGAQGVKGDDGDAGSGEGSRYVSVAVARGESGSGGQSLNTDLTTGERAVRPALQILNNTTMQFESLKIGDPNGNQMIGHDGPYGPIPGTLHGWENGWAHSFEEGMWYSPVGRMAKTGQGGCTAAQLNSDLYFQPFVDRVTAVKNLILAEGKIPNFYVLYSQGINDKDQGVDLAQWKIETKTQWAKIRAELGFVPIIVQLFWTGYEDVNAAYQELAEEVPFIFLVSSAGAGLQDSKHLNAAGNNQQAHRMAEVCIEEIGQEDAYILSQAKALYEFMQKSPATPSVPIVPIPAEYNTLSKSVDSGDGVVTYDAGAATTNGGAGATVIEDVNCTVPFEVTYERQGNPDAVVVAFDTASTADYSPGKSWPGLAYFFGGALYVGTNQTNPSLTVSVGSGIQFVKWVNSGNDLLLKTSTDGVSYITAYTHAGILAGRTSMKLRVQFAQGSGAARLLYWDANQAVAGPDWTEIENKPSTFPPSAHLHALTQLLQSGATVGQVVRWNGSNWVPSNESAGGGDLFAPKVYNIVEYGAVGDGKALKTATITAGSSTLTVTAGSFTPDDVGKSILVNWMGAAGVDVLTTIAGYTSSSVVTLATSATQTVNSTTRPDVDRMVYYGTDNTAAIQATIDAAWTRGYSEIYGPKGIYMVAGALITSDNIGNNPNSQLYIPSNVGYPPLNESGIPRTVKFRMEAPASMFESGFANTYSESYVNGAIIQSLLPRSAVSGVTPAVIGTRGPTTYLGSFNAVEVHMEGVWVRTHHDPTYGAIMSGIILRHASNTVFTTCRADIDVSAYHTVRPTAQTVGIMGVQSNAATVNEYHRCMSVGYSFGYSKGEHTVSINCCAFACTYGMDLQSGGHGSTIIKFLSQWNEWSVSGKQIDNGYATNHHYFSPFSMTIEQIVDEDLWYSTKGDIYDPGSVIYASLVFSCNLSGGGPVYKLVKTGGAHIREVHMRDAPGMFANFINDNGSRPTGVPPGTVVLNKDSDAFDVLREDGVTWFTPNGGDRFIRSVYGQPLRGEAGTGKSLVIGGPNVGATQGLEVQDAADAIIVLQRTGGTNGNYGFSVSESTAPLRIINRNTSLVLARFIPTGGINFPDVSSTPPTPTSGVTIYSQGGILYTINTSGTVTPL